MAKPPAPDLGGHRRYVVTDGELVTSVINPGHTVRLQKGRTSTSADGTTRMPDFANVMTVRQLIDIVAFLHTAHIAETALPKGL